MKPILISWRDWVSTKRLVILLAIFGVAERTLANLLRAPMQTGPRDPGSPGEALNVAVAIAQGRGFADAFAEGQGPTAHLLPISPAIAGAVYSLLGIHSLASELVLASWSIGLAIGTYLLLFKAFAHLKSSVGARLGALAFACLIPTYLGQETVDFRYWEGGLAVFLCALFLERLLAFQDRARLGTREIAWMCLLAALLFFVNPLLGVGTYACAALFCWKKMDTAQIVTAIPLSACMLGIFLTAWTVRNEVVLGHPVLLRSNLGLELAAANYPGALDNADPGERFQLREEEIQPRSSDNAYKAMIAAGGEIPYSARLKEITLQWIRANPGQVMRLAMIHLRQIFMPQAWEFNGHRGGSLRMLFASLAGVLGIVAIGYALVRRRTNWVYPALLVLLPALCYSLFQPVSRYTYLFYPILVFSAADLLGGNFWRKAGSTGGAPEIQVAYDCNLDN